MHNKLTKPYGANGEALPVAKKEVVEYSAELADADDREAEQRAAEADGRQQGGNPSKRSGSV